MAEHASDASSAAVRAAAIHAVTLLLEAPQSHAVLRPLLPSLGNLIHDKVEKVRLAVARLLLRIKKIPGIKYYHIVPVEHLAARLADEGRRNPTSAVASALTLLMVNSYFPSQATAEVQIQRTLAFLQTEPTAAAVFYANLATHVSVDAVTKLMVMLLKTLSAAVETEMTRDVGRKRRRFGRQQGDNDPQEDPTVLSVSDTAVMARLIETICTLWQSIEGVLEQKGNEDLN